MSAIEQAKLKMTPRISKDHEFVPNLRNVDALETFGWRGLSFFSKSVALGFLALLALATCLALSDRTASR